MRRILSVLTFAVALSHPASADEPIRLKILTPGFTYNAGIVDLAHGFQSEKGIPVNVQVTGMSKMLQEAVNGTPEADVIFLPENLMDQLEKEGGVVAGTRINIGRVKIGLAVHKGDPIPDISTIDKLATVLKSAGSVMYSNPASGSMEANLIDKMLKSHSQFTSIKTKIALHSEGGEAVARGEGQLALQLMCEILNHPESLSSAGPVPDELHAWIDGAAAVSVRSKHPQVAMEWLQYATQPGTYALWLGRGLERMK